MRFEWDEEKRQSNIAKHGIDFSRAALLFDGRDVIETLSAFADEERWQTTGIVDERFMTVIWTRRDDVIRLISARRARDGEKRDYYNNYP
ncbi:MAG TPA: BrnT family toxin [Thermomicrobiales bacterium]|nr:BrnT family toxin [Thermomicrobiales bacterium]